MDPLFSSGRLPVVEANWDIIDWEMLPYDKTLRERCNVVFQVEEKLIPAHSSRLISRYPYFQALLVSPFRENPLETPIKVQEVSLETFRNFIWYVYKDSIPKHLNELEGLKTYADMVDDQGLVLKCHKTILPIVEDLKKTIKVGDGNDLDLWMEEQGVQFRDICRYVHFKFNEVGIYDEFIKNEYTHKFNFYLTNDDLNLIKDIEPKIILRASEEFEMFEYKWRIHLSYFFDAKKYGIFLELLEPPKSPITLRSKWKFDLVELTSVHTQKHTFSKCEDFGVCFGMAVLPPLRHLIEHDKLHFEFSVKRQSSGPD